MNTMIELLDGTSDSTVKPIVNRRDFMKGGVAGAAAISLVAASKHVMANFSSDYGPVMPVADESTGLPLLQLPAGFKYWSYGWTGMTMKDGTPTPGAHDGMGVVAAQGNTIALVRNHEIRGASAAVKSPAVYDSQAGGGTSNLLFDVLNGRWLASYMSLSGTSTNCAGGITPWGTWLSCEETTDTHAGTSHGWVFEVPGFGVANAKPIKGLGRRAHEATATDPVTGYVYATEDAGTSSGFYRYRPFNYGNLLGGGVLEMLKIKNFPQASLLQTYPDGTQWDVEWVTIDEPESINPRNYTQGFNKGAARFARLEGAWYDTGLIYFTSTSGGGISGGQVFHYDPRREKLTLVFESRNNTDHPVAPDNMTVSPRGGILLCEDRGGISRLMGLTQAGEVFEFGRNNILLSAADAAIIHSKFPGSEKRITAGNHIGAETCGACFHDRWLFVNIQTPGVTFAITGPWNEGVL
jgi:secreted PhoX family phosphatase